jgi:hypothetical protein
LITAARAPQRALFTAGAEHAEGLHLQGSGVRSISIRKTARIISHNEG